MRPGSPPPLGCASPSLSDPLLHSERESRIYETSGLASRFWRSSIILNKSWVAHISTRSFAARCGIPQISTNLSLVQEIGTWATRLSSNPGRQNSTTGPRFLWQDIIEKMDESCPPAVLTRVETQGAPGCSDLGLSSYRGQACNVI